MKRFFLKLTNKVQSNNYSALEWKCAQIPILLLVFAIYVDALFVVDRPEFYAPKNICNLLPCEWLQVVNVKWIFLLAFVGSSVLYLIKRFEIWGAALLAFFSFMVFSYYECYGIKGEYGLFTLLFAVQSIAMYRRTKNNSDNYNEYFQFSLQVIAVAYCLSGFNKLLVSGPDWFIGQSMNFITQSYIANYEEYVSSGQDWHYHYGLALFGWLHKHVFVIQLFLFFSVVLELCSFVLAIEKSVAFYYALLLTCFHIGIYLGLKLVLFTLAVPMLALAINPMYLLRIAINKISKTHIRK